MLQMVLPSLQSRKQELNIKRKNGFMDKIVNHILQTVNQVLRLLYIIFSESLCDNSSIEKHFSFLSCLFKMHALLVSHMSHTASTQWDCYVSKHHHNGKNNGMGWILEHKIWPWLDHFPSADRQIASGTFKSRRPVLLTGSDSRSPRATEIEMHCPERFNKIVVHPQRWAPSHSHFASA